MNGTVPVTIFYMITYAAFFVGLFLFKKTESEQKAFTWLPLTAILTEFYSAFVAAIINLLSIPVNVGTLGIFNLLVAIPLLYFVFAKKKVQKYTVNRYDIIFAVLLVAVVLFGANVRWGLTELNWNYRTVDPSARYREAMEFVNNEAISRMFFAQLLNGTVIELFSPWLAYDYYYKLYVLSDIFQILLSGFMFYGVVCRFAKDRFGKIVTIIASFFFLLGYPMNSTLYGFTYLGMSLYVVAALLVLTDLFMQDEMEHKWLNILFLMLGAHAIFQCYALFMPVTYLAMGFAFLMKQFRNKKLVSLQTLAEGLEIFLVPIILGLVYTYMDVFVNDNVTVESAFSAEGAIYRDLYSNFLFFIPIAVYGYFGIIKKKKNSFMGWFAPLFALQTLAMFAISYKTGKISTYYFYKDYYMLWFIVFALLVGGFVRMTAEARKMTCLYLCSWLFVAIMFLFGIENKIEAKNALFVPDNKAQHYNDLLCFNYNTMFTEHYSDEKMELIHYVYNELLSSGVTDKQVPVCTIQEETYLYESMTGQRLSDYEFWKSHEDDDAYFANVLAYCEYVCVYTDCDLYTVHQDFWDQFEVVYANDAGKIVKITTENLEYLK